MGFYTDCINPFHKPNHGFWSNGQVYSFSKICPECWYRALKMERNPQPITFIQEKPKAFKQCGSDTL